MSCHLCGATDVELYMSCCGAPADGSSGVGTCSHDDGEPACDDCGAAEGWWPHEDDLR